MRFAQIFNIFSKHGTSSSSSGVIANQTAANPSVQNSFDQTWPETDRRINPDRRQQERRVFNYQPYIDTRKNHGRRRSFGRRASDQASALPF